MKKYIIDEERLLGFISDSIVMRECRDDYIDYDHYDELAKKDLEEMVKFGEIQEVE
jgi:hypothetical protein